jgi:AraC family transcriptional regulator, transcriptional activator of pobA
MTPDITVQMLPQFTGGQDWRVALAHDRPHHLLIWTLRGQGRLLLDGTRRGLGTHNALWIPAGSLFSLDIGRQGAAQVVTFPAGTGLRLPESPCQMRIRDAQTQNELTGFIEAAQREQNGTRPLRGDALEAHAALISVWLRRQTVLEEHVPAPGNAAARVSAAYAAMLPGRFGSGDTMAAYAAYLGITPTHLTRSVKAATGRTAAELLTERILHEARELLLRTREPAQEIARHLGFGSAAYFTRFMQQHTGRTPSKLRN